jgi:NTP pyrophosphatase (non-canonical NTP hydrolase)
MTEEMFLDITRWNRATFPTSLVAHKLNHLKQEVDELIFDVKNNLPSKRKEFADCFILLFCAAETAGMSYDDICDAILEKMNINKQREWGKPDENGVINHIKKSQ